MKLFCVSDTHGNHEDIPLKPADAFCHSGDFTSVGQWKEYKIFIDWLRRQDYEYKIICPGNHDFICQDAHAACLEYANLNGIYFLSDESLELEGIKFYGCPWTKWFHNWAFNEYEPQIGEKFKLIPEDTNVLITHGPPSGIQEMCKNDRGEDCGSPSLMPRLKQLTKLKVCLFGHIHEGYGAKTVSMSKPPLRKITHQPLLINASMAGNKEYRWNKIDPRREGFIVEV